MAHHVSTYAGLSVAASMDSSKHQSDDTNIHACVDITCFICSAAILAISQMQDRWLGQLV